MGIQFGLGRVGRGGTAVVGAGTGTTTVVVGCVGCGAIITVGVGGETGADVVGDGKQYDGLIDDMAQIFCLIQLSYALTLVLTAGVFGRAQPSPKLTKPTCMVVPFANNGPPESP